MKEAEINTTKFGPLKVRCKRGKGKTQIQIKIKNLLKKKVNPLKVQKNIKTSNKSIISRPGL